MNELPPSVSIATPSRPRFRERCAMWWLKFQEWLSTELKR